MSPKIHLKNILIGVAIGLALMFLTGLIIYYILVFLPHQETKKLQRGVEEYERLMLERHKQQKIEQ